MFASLPPRKYELKSVDVASKPGGFKSANKKAMTDAANALKNEVLKEADDAEFSCYEIVSRNKQVVADMTYQIKVKVGDKKYASIIYRSLPPFNFELKRVTFIDESNELPKLVDGVKTRNRKR